MSDQLGSGLFETATGKQLWYRPLPYADKRFSPDGRWILVTTTQDSQVYDIQGNFILQIAHNGREKGISDSHVGWLNNDGTRYVYAARDVDARSGEVDVIQIYSILVAPP